MTISFRTKTAQGWTINAPYKPFTFPDGAAHLKGTESSPEGNLLQIADIRGHDPQDLFHLAMWADFMSQFKNPGKLVILLPYLPGARMDRGLPRGAVVYADFLRILPNIDKIITLDPHSPEMPKLLMDNLAEFPFERIIRREIGLDKGIVGVIAPDKGATDRAQRAANVLHVPIFHAEKTRNFETGQLSGFTCETLPTEGKLLLVDDICDGGGTFVGLADTLQIEQGIGPERLDLWVTHGIFSGGDEKSKPLLDAFGTVHTTNSFFNSENHSEAFRRRVGSQIKVHDVLPYLTGEINV